MGIQTAMDRISEAATIVEAMRAADDVAFEAGRDPGVRTLRVLSAALAGADDLAAIAAVHALAEMNDEEAGRVLTGLLSDRRAFIVEHAAAALGRRPVRAEAVGRLIRLVSAGGFTGMLAQHTLEKWSSGAGELLAVALETAATGVLPYDARARLVETMGLVRHTLATRPLRAWATDATAPAAVREAAIAALGQRREPAALATLEDLVSTGGELGDLARLALIDAEPAPAAREEPAGLTVAQLFLHADVDPSLAKAGAGDNGGIATLLVRLGDALVGDPASGVRRVLTLSRGSAAQAGPDLLQVAGGEGGHVFGHIPLSPPPVSSAAAWPLRVAVRRGIRRLLRAAGRVDVLHLRMADVGSLAAADVARELGIPTVFTVAPDPHSVIASLERSGALTREGFGAADLAEHFWFRTHLVQSLAASAAHSVFFPRPELERDMRALVGIDLASHPERHTVVAEGVDLAVVDRAVTRARSVAAGAEPTGALQELAALLDALPPERQALPLIVTVGRMHRVKGMASLVQTWAGGLADRANLLVVGGDLENPSQDEREQLDRIRALVPAREQHGRGLLLTGHRSNDVAAEWLAAARFGLPGRAAAGGVYVCASLKEEFGLAILEAMASGLLVVAPDSGGPATYVSDDDTGFLVETSDLVRLEGAIVRALDRAAAGDAGAAERARELVAARFTIQGMARMLAPVYGSVARAEAELRRAAAQLA
jgi:glycosyltransferase involved in cell wall biosynthesis